jgi:hypothetical protein
MMLGSDINSPAELVAKYGEVSIHWTTGLAYVGRHIPDSGWVTYLELARIRELTQGEG